MAYTQPIFVAGARYRAKLTFTSGPASTFYAGEILVFKRDTYSPYDDSFVYIFLSERDGQTKEWWLLDGEPIDKWHQFFDPWPLAS